MLTKRCFPTAFLTILASVQGISYESAPLDENGIPKYKGRKRGRKPKKRLRKRNPNAKKRSHTAYTLVSRFGIVNFCAKFNFFIVSRILYDTLSKRMNPLSFTLSLSRSSSFKRRIPKLRNSTELLTQMETQIRSSPKILSLSSRSNGRKSHPTRKKNGSGAPKNFQNRWMMVMGQWNLKRRVMTTKYMVMAMVMSMLTIY
jgi:hypothetical protein